MTKTRIIDQIASSRRMRRDDVHKIVDSFLEAIKESIERDEEVQIRGFGTFFKLEKKARKVFSPIAQKNIDIPGKKTIGFKASKIAETKYKYEGA